MFVLLCHHSSCCRKRSHSLPRSELGSSFRGCLRVSSMRRLAGEVVRWLAKKLPGDQRIISQRRQLAVSSLLTQSSRAAPRLPRVSDSQQVAGSFTLDFASVELPCMTWSAPPWPPLVSRPRRVDTYVGRQRKGEGGAGDRTEASSRPGEGRASDQRCDGGGKDKQSRVPGAVAVVSADRRAVRRPTWANGCSNRCSLNRCSRTP